MTTTYIAIKITDGQCPECGWKIHNHHANCPIGLIDYEIVTSENKEIPMIAWTAESDPLKKGTDRPFRERKPTDDDNPTLTIKETWGLTIDMLDVDQLRYWSRHLLGDGGAARRKAAWDLANRLDTAVREIGMLREALAAERSASHRLRELPAPDTYPEEMLKSLADEARYGHKNTDHEG